MDKSRVVIFLSFVIIVCTSFYDGYTFEGVLIRTYDKRALCHTKNSVPIDYEEKTTLYPIDRPDTTSFVFLLPDKHIAKTLSNNFSIPDNWVSLKDSIEIWFKDAPYQSSNDSSRLEKKIQVVFEIDTIDSCSVGSNIYNMLINDYYYGDNRKNAKLYLIKDMKKRQFSFPEKVKP